MHEIAQSCVRNAQKSFATIGVLTMLPKPTSQLEEGVVNSLPKALSVDAECAKTTFWIRPGEVARIWR